jgi:hypothetical protein
MKNFNFPALIFTVSLFVFLAEFTNSQPIYPYKVWEKIYNAPSNLQDSSVSINKNSLGMVFVAGWSLGTSTNSDIVALRYNPDTGDTIWAKRYIGAGEDRTSAMVCDNNGVYVTGWSYTGPNRDLITIKFNAVNGDTVWVKKYNGPGNGGDYGYSIAADAGFVYVTGRVDNGGAQKIVVLKYDINTGNQASGFPYIYTGTLSTNADVAFSIKADGSGNAYVTGRANFSPGPGDIITIKVNSNGTLGWEKKHNCPLNLDDGGVHLVLDNAGSNVFVSGYSFRITAQDYVTLKYSAATGDSLAFAVYNFSGIDLPTDMAIDASNNITVTGWSLNPANRYCFATVRYNSNLVQQWVARTSAVDGNDLANQITVGSAGDIYVTGCSFKTGQGYDIYTIRYNSTGDTLWTARYNGTANGNDYGSEVAVIDTTRVFVTGSVIMSPASTSSIYTVRYSTQIVGINPISSIVPKSFNVEQNYPNPFNPTTIFRFDIPKESMVNITIFDVLGRAVEVLANETLKPGTYEAKWDASNYASGMYFYKVQADAFTMTKKMILTK